MSSTEWTPGFAAYLAGLTFPDLSGANLPEGFVVPVGAIR